MDGNPPMRLPTTPQAPTQLSPSAIPPKRVVKTSRVTSRNAAAKRSDIPTGSLDGRLQLVIRDHDCPVLPIPLSEVRGVGALFSAVFDWRAVDLHFFVALPAEDGPGTCVDADEGHGVVGAFDVEVAEEDGVAFFEDREGFYVGAAEVGCENGAGHGGIG